MSGRESGEEFVAKLAKRNASLSHGPFLGWMRGSGNSASRKEIDCLGGPGAEAWAAQENRQPLLKGKTCRASKQRMKEREQERQRKQWRI